VNPPESPHCSKCAAALTLSLEERWAASRAGRLVSRAGLAWRGAGWLLYYGVLAAVLLGLGALHFGGGALRELFASLAVLVASAAVVLGGLALGRGGGDLLSRGVLALAAGTLSGLALLFGVLWAAAPFPPFKPLATVRLFPDGRVRLETPGGAAVEAPGQLKEGVVEFRLRSAFLSWPLMQVRQTVPVSLGGQALTDPWVADLLDKGARRFAGDAPQRPRVSLREDSLFAAPGGPYVLREPADGAGTLVLEAPAEKS
jgi:hypothetical protein